MTSSPTNDGSETPAARRGLKLDRLPPQAMQGFEQSYTDIVDYAVRSTRRIWHERDIGLIYSHLTHNCVTYTALGTLFDRESHIHDTIGRIAEFSGRETTAEQVLWHGDGNAGFQISHMIEETGRHTEYGPMGRPTGRSFHTRMARDCLLFENKVYKQWIVRDTMTQLMQLGIDPHDYASGLARQLLGAGHLPFQLGENRRILGQYPPASEADVSIARRDIEAELLRWLHHVYNKRLLGKVMEVYADDCQWHGPLGRELTGPRAVQRQILGLIALMPDGAFTPQHICSNESGDGGVRIALRWTLDGHHLGYGPLGPPTGHSLFLLGVTHFHIQDGKIIDEWAVYDELAMLVQIKQAELAAAQGPGTMAPQEAAETPLHTPLAAD